MTCWRNAPGSAGIPAGLRRTLKIVGPREPKVGLPDLKVGSPAGTGRPPTGTDGSPESKVRPPDLKVGPPAGTSGPPESKVGSPVGTDGSPEPKVGPPAGTGHSPDGTEDPPAGTSLPPGGTDGFSRFPPRAPWTPGQSRTFDETLLEPLPRGGRRRDLPRQDNRSMCRHTGRVGCLGRVPG